MEVTDEGARDPVIGPLAPRFTGFQWHSYEAVPPEGAAILARSPVCPQAYRVGESAWGIQFHAEVTAADAANWIADYRTDEDAVRIGVDPEALGAETREKIEDWSRLGRELCGRFLDAISQVLTRREPDGFESLRRLAVHRHAGDLVALHLVDERVALLHLDTASLAPPVLHREHIHLGTTVTYLRDLLAPVIEGSAPTG